MIKTWLYFIALILPLAVRVLAFNSGVVNWLWYHEHYAIYNILNSLRNQQQFIEFIAGWPLPVFTGTVLTYWMSEDREGIAHQFLLLPLVYVPFTIIGDVLVSREFHPENLYVHPLVIIPIGYIYVFAWAAFIRILDKMQLVL